MITNEQKVALADYIIKALKKEKVFKDNADFIDLEQLEETCMAGTIICEGLVKAKIIKSYD